MTLAPRGAYMVPATISTEYMKEIVYFWLNNNFLKNPRRKSVACFTQQSLERANSLILITINDV